MIRSFAPSLPLSVSLYLASLAQSPPNTHPRTQALSNSFFQSCSLFSVCARNLRTEELIVSGSPLVPCIEYLHPPRSLTFYSFSPFARQSFSALQVDKKSIRAPILREGPGNVEGVVEASSIRSRSPSQAARQNLYACADRCCIQVVKAAAARFQCTGRRRRWYDKWGGGMARQAAALPDRPFSVLQPQASSRLGCMVCF
jgi:hypothetical protein